MTEARSIPPLSPKPEGGGGASAPEPPPADAFPRSFWTANVTELLERGAYSAIVPFLVLYLGRLGLGRYWPSALSGLLWGLLYLLPVLSGAVADRVGFRLLLTAGFAVLGLGYALLGSPVALGFGTLTDSPAGGESAPLAVWLIVLSGTLLVGFGGAVVKPCITATIQKAGRARPALAFGVLVTFVNVGSVLGRGSAHVVRTRVSLPSVFTLGALASSVAFASVLAFYPREPSPADAAVDVVRRKTELGAALRATAGDVLRALRDPRLSWMLLASTGFMFLTGQVYNLVPLYLANVLEPNPPIDLYTLINPVAIALFQIRVTRRFGRVGGVRSILVGTLIVGFAMTLHVVALFVPGGPRAPALFGMTVGAVLVVVSVALVAVGEMFATARMYQLIGSFAPAGQEGLYLGCAGLPVALGYLTGGIAGAVLFHDVMCRGAVATPSGVLDLSVPYAALGWGALLAVAIASAAGLWRYDVWSRARHASAATGARAL